MASVVRAAPAAAGMSTLATELLEMIFAHVDVPSLCSSALVCRRWLRLLGPTVCAHHVVDMEVTFEEHCCDMVVHAEKRAVNGADAYALQLSMCQCVGEHVQRHVSTLRALVPYIAQRCQQLIIEDYFLLRSSFIANDTIDALFAPLQEIGENLCWLEMHNVDVSRISARSLVLVGRMKQLGQLSLVQCGVRLRLDADLLLHDRIYATMLRDALTQLQLTHSPHVTDRLLRYISRQCVQLWYIDVSHCAEVTAMGVAHFCDTLRDRQPDIMYMQLTATGVCGEELQKHLMCQYSPVYKRGPWKLSHVPSALASVKASAISTVCGVGMAACARTAQLPHKQLLMLV